MEEIHPLSSHFNIDEQAGSLHIILPVKKNWHHIMYMGSFAFIGVILAYNLVAALVWGTEMDVPSTDVTSLAFRALWEFFILSLMMAMGLIGLRNVLWQFFGKEIVEVQPHFIKIGQEVLGFRRSHEYATENIRNLRTFSSGRGHFEWDFGALLWNRVNGTIGFDYGAKVIRFANNLNVIEAKQIIAVIQQRFP